MQLIEKDCGENCPICGGYSKYYGYKTKDNNIYIYHICNNCDREFETVYRYDKT